MFRTRAAKLQKLVAAEVPSVKFEVNLEKPRKGFFEVRVQGAKKPVLSLGPMPRPFKPLRETVMDELAAKVVAALG